MRVDLEKVVVLQPASVERSRCRRSMRLLASDVYESCEIQNVQGREAMLPLSL